MSTIDTQRKFINLTEQSVFKTLMNLELYKVTQLQNLFHFDNIKSIKLFPRSSNKYY